MRRSKWTPSVAGPGTPDPALGQPGEVVGRERGRGQWCGVPMQNSLPSGSVRVVQRMPNSSLS